MPAATDVRYRLARPDDAEAIAALHAESWGVAYRGMFPNDYLDGPVFDDRADLWRTRFTDPEREGRTLTILAERGGELAGFAHSIYDHDAHGTLLDNLHVRKTDHRGGIGTRLMLETAGRLVAFGRSKLYLWVLESNETARSFYRALRGEECGRGSAADGPSNPRLPAVPSFRICWLDVSVLIEHP